MVQNKFWSQKKIWYPKNFGPKKCWSKKIFGPKKFLVRIIFWSEKNFGPKKGIPMIMRALSQHMNIDKTSAN